MSLENDITGIKHNLDEDVFKSATDDDLENREAKKQEEIKRKQREEREREIRWENENGRTIDTCPHCGANFRDEDVGIVAHETQYNDGYLGWFPESTYDNWQWQETDVLDTEVTGYACGACGEEIKRGSDFDIKL